MLKTFKYTEIKGSITLFNHLILFINYKVFLSYLSIEFSTANDVSLLLAAASQPAIFVPGPPVAAAATAAMDVRLLKYTPIGYTPLPFT